jgi:hypothetical protein
MGDVIEAIEFLGIPMSIAIIVIGMFFVSQIIGEMIELSGKIVPEIFKVRKYFQRIKREKQETKETLKQVQQSLVEFNKHYSSDNIQQRDAWMSWVNNRAEVYDNALEELLLLKDKLNENNEITLDLYINANRNRILDFSRIAADDKALISREEFNRIYKINTEYHATLDKYHRENGEVDTAIKIINEAYDYRLRNRCFIEDIRGYNTTQ